MLSTWDDDVLELRLHKSLAKSARHNKLAILCHGLEGSAEGPYMKGMAQHLSQQGWDILRWSYRGCNGKPNKRLYTYHSGKTEDLAAVVDYASNKLDYAEHFLVGFSVGGNLVLKFLADYKNSLAQKIDRSISISAPLDLESCSRELAKKKNIIYMKRFLKTLRRKMQARSVEYPGSISTKGIRNLKNFLEFDEAFTAPLNGFLSAQDYWKNSSAIHVLHTIEQPFCILSSIDDPFLGASCFPEKQKLPTSGQCLYTRYGGHLGFMTDLFGDSHVYWHEECVTHFLRTGSVIMPPEILLNK